MRVGVVVYGLEGSFAGIGRYTLHLTRALGADTSGLELVLLAAGGIGPSVGAYGRLGVALPGCGRLPGLLTLGNLVIPARAWQHALSLVHDPTGVTPFLFGAGRARTVVTVHDVFAWSIPGHSTRADTLIYRHWLPRVLPRVDAVITVSQASKADIVRHLGVPADKVHVTYEGVGHSYTRASVEQVSKVRAEYGLPDGYLLFVGSVEERKNLSRLLQACAQLWATGERRPLVVVGARRWKYSQILQTVQDLDLESRVHFPGHVPEADLPALYSGADLFIFPSLYEGFGLPPLEAMACGTPVVCSNAASLPEVVGDAAITVDPYDVEALADAMHRVLSDPDLAHDLRRRGLERAAGFTWEQTARKTVEVYREVLS
ncbi:MAG TPA: glycosyltransferase family 1 protein [Phycisphaerae bacterium]|nr:glycosyltransferase family 1 protein [Phycisphaerae bacterium]